MYEMVRNNFPNSEYGGQAYYGCRDAGIRYADALCSSGELIVRTPLRDVCVKPENMDDPSNYVMFYVCAGEEVFVNVAERQLYVQICCGRKPV